jgi:hypothetical protein
LDLKEEVKWEEENYILWSFITCTLHKILLGWPNQEDEKDET